MRTDRSGLMALVWTGLACGGTSPPATETPSAPTTPPTPAEMEQEGATEASGGSVPGEAPAQAIDLACRKKARDVQGDAGESLVVACPSGCTTGGAVWGTDTYTGDSAICAAGVHAGVIPASGGAFELELGPGQPKYVGSARNGVTSGDYGKYGLSLIVKKAH